MSVLRKRPQQAPAPASLTLAIVLALGMPGSAPGAATATPPSRTPMVVFTVTNCDDHGPGSLRDTIAGAADGDTIDLTQLTCSTISLTTGEIVVGQKGLSIVGPGADRLKVQRSQSGGAGHWRIFHFTNTSGAGASDANTLSGLKVSGGYVYDSNGGCIMASGDLAVIGAVVRDCTVKARPQGGQYVSRNGGAISAERSLRLVSSEVSYSTMFSEVGHGYFDGGCIWVQQALSVEYSTIDNCAVYSAFSSGGGISSTSDTKILNSTLSNNRLGAGELGRGTGAALSAAINVGAPLIIVNSTISGNFSWDGTSLLSRSGTYIFNSTIARNHSTTSTYAAVRIEAPLFLSSTIIAANYTGPDHSPLSDLEAPSVSGDHNLITHSWAPVPADTLQADPHLQYLVDNGGPTRTLALAADSPAIDRGINQADLPSDQRGHGFPRVAGAAADIGAFESPSRDRVFSSGFDPPS